MTGFGKSRVGVARPAETVSYLMFVLFALAAVYWVCYFSPVTYMRLITEDQWGEYATAVSFGLAGLMLLMLALGSDVRSGRISWALVGIFALLFAAEELSWGQRIFKLLFGLDIAPDAIVEINNQGEFNLHNMGNIDFLNRGGLRRMAGQLILIWTLFSLSVERLRPNWIDRMETSGLPIVRMHLAPFFFVVSFYFLLSRLPHADELGELSLGIAVLSWTTDLFLRHRVASSPRGMPAVSRMAGVYVLCAVLTAPLVWVVPGGLTHRLNYVAHYSYPRYGMYEQAEKLYAYIYANPKYLRPETRINHGRMLLGLGKTESGHKQLRTALSEMLDSPEDGQPTADYLRRKAIIYAMLGDDHKASKLFAVALAADETRIELTNDAEQKAELLFSVAQTREAMGDVQMALHTARRARELAGSAKLSRTLDRWIADRSKHGRSRP